VFKIANEEKLDMSLIKESSNFVEEPNPSVNAFREYNLLSNFKEKGFIKKTCNSSQIKIIEQFASFMPEEQDEYLLQLQSKFSTLE
jgi:hypothetical protein